MATYYKVVKFTALPDQPGFTRETTLDGQHKTYSEAAERCAALNLAENDEDVRYRVRTFDF